MRISDNFSSSNINVSQNNEIRVPQTSVANNNTYKDAFKLDINPKYMQQGMKEDVLIADSEVLFYNKNLFLTHKSY